MDIVTAKSSRPPPLHGEAPPPRRLGRVLRAVGIAGGTGATFVVALVGGTLLHVGTPVARRVVVAQVNGVLGSVLAGKLTLDRVGALSPRGASGVDLHVADPEGRLVLVAQGVSARISPLTLLLGVLPGKGDMVLRVEQIAVDHVEGRLIPDADGTPSLARAFRPAKESPDDPSARGLDLQLPRVTLRHAWVHGTGPLPIMDVELTGLAAGARVAKVTSAEITSLGVDARALVAVPVHADVEGKITLPEATTLATLDGSTRVRVRAGDVRAALDARLAQGNVDATLDVPTATPEQIATLLPTLRLGAPVSVRAEVHGTLPALDAKAVAHLGRGQVDVRAHTDLGDDTKAHAEIDVAHLDARAAVPTFPSTDVDARLVVDAVRRATGALDGGLTLATRATRIAGQPVPAVDLRAAVAQAAGASLPTAQGEARVHEPGAPTTVTFDFHETKAGPAVLFTTDTRVAELGAVARLHGVDVHGSARVSTRGTAFVVSQRVEASAGFELSNVRVSGVSLERGALAARAGGTFARPTFDARFDGRGLTQGAFRFATADLRVQGAPDEVRASAALGPEGDSPTVTLRATVGLGAAISVRDAEATATRGDVTARLHVARARIAGPRIDVQGATLEGLGEPVRIEAHVAPRELAVTAEAPRIDLARLARLAKLEGRLHGGNVRLDAFAGMHRGAPYGEVDLAAENVRWETYQPAWATVKASVDGRHLRAKVDAEMDQVGVLGVDSDLAITGALGAKAFAEALGSVTIDGSADVAKIAALLPAGTLPVKDPMGIVDVKARATREVTGLLPDVSLLVGTRGLSVTLAPEDVPVEDYAYVRKSRRIVLEGVDVRALASLDGASALSELAVAAHDAKGILLYADAKADLPLGELYAARGDAGALAQRLADVAFAAHVEMPNRPLHDLPKAVGVLPADADLAIGIDARGTVRKPFVDVGIRALGVRAPDAQRGKPLDVTARVVWDGAHASARAMVVSERRTVLDAYVTGSAPRDDLSAWNASARARLQQLEVGDLAFMIGERLRGKVTGALAVDNLHVDPTIDATLDVTDFGPTRASGLGVKAHLTANATGATADVAMAQTDGSAKVALRVPLAWTDHTVPALDPKRGVGLDYELRAFRLAPFAPFVRSAVGGLDGRLDGKGDVKLAGDFATGQMTGFVALKDGKANVPQLGEELHDISARVTISPWGTVRVDGVSAKGSTGRVTAQGLAKLDGFALQHVEGNLRIAKDEAFPVALNGVPLGEVSGAVDVRADARNGGKDLDVKVSVPSLAMRLPETAGRSVQELDPEESVVIGDERPDGQMVKLALDRATFQELQDEANGVDRSAAAAAKAAAATALHVSVDLGRDLEVRRGTMLKVGVTGHVTADIAEGKTVIGGQVEVPSGFVEIQGKKFSVEHVVVTFPDGEADNPMIVATAYYDAPDRTRVYADFRGTIKDGTVILRSDPPHTKDEILAVLLFGTADGALGAPGSARQRQQGVSTQAVSVGGGFVTQGLNKVLSGVSPVEITTRIGTNESNNPRPELAVQVAKNVTAQVGYNVGLPAPGQNPDRTMFMVDWRFRPRWSVITTVGDRGSSIVDFMWRKTY